MALEKHTEKTWKGYVNFQIIPIKYVRLYFAKNNNLNRVSKLSQSFFG